MSNQQFLLKKVEAQRFEILVAVSAIKSIVMRGHYLELLHLCFDNASDLDDAE